MQHGLLLNHSSMLCNRQGSSSCSSNRRSGTSMACTPRLMASKQAMHSSGLQQLPCHIQPIDSRAAVGQLRRPQSCLFQLSAAAGPQGSHAQSCRCRRADQGTELVVACHKIRLAVDLQTGGEQGCTVADLQAHTAMEASCTSHVAAAIWPDFMQQAAGWIRSAPPQPPPRHRPAPRLLAPQPRDVKPSCSQLPAPASAAPQLPPLQAR